MTLNTNETLETSLELPVVPIAKTFEYQPTDENGLPIGGRQVIKYTDPDELPYLLAEQNTLLVRKLREQTRKVRLGITENDTIQDDAQRQAKPVAFQPKALSKEQRAQLSRDILDEETFDKAITTVFESAIGASADDFRKEFTELREDNNNLKAIREVEVFQAKNPEYIVCDENAKAIVNWLLRYDLALTAANFQTAYNTLKEAGLLITSTEKVTNAVYTPPPAPVALEDTAALPDGVRTPLPVDDELPDPIVLVEEHPALLEQSTPPPIKVVSRVPLSLNRESSSGDAATPASSASDSFVYEHVNKVTGQKTVYTGQKALDALPSDEYRRRLNTPGFSKLVAKIEAETAAKNAARRAGR